MCPTQDTTALYIQCPLPTMGVCITGVVIRTGGKFCLAASLGLENCEVIEKRLFLKFELKSVIRNFFYL